MARCKRCSRPLETPESIQRGYGLVCKKKQDAADAEFERIQITIDEEIKYQTAVKS